MGRTKYHVYPYSLLIRLLGLHADLNETYPVGKVDEDSKKLMRVTRQCLDEAIKICKPGALIRDIGKVMYVPKTRKIWSIS